MAEYINTAITRINLMQKAAITKPDGIAPEAYENPFVSGSSYPYWLTWVGPFTVQQRNPNEEIRQHDITMRLVLGHIREDYQGARAELLNDYIVQALDYFNQRPLLKRTSSDTSIPYLQPGIGATITSGTGISVDNENQIVYCDFTLTIPFLVRISRIL